MILSHKLLVSTEFLIFLNDAHRLHYVDDQCRLYRNYMNNGTGLWQHIILGNPAAHDFGYWSTGNAWAAWGMLRVLVTMMHSEYRAEMEAQKQDLQNWIVEILQAAYPHTNVSDYSVTSVRVILLLNSCFLILDHDRSATQLLRRRHLLRGRLYRSDGIRIIPDGTARPRLKHDQQCPCSS